MAEEKEAKIGGSDRLFARLSNWLSERIAAFVAFLFVLFGAGAIYGAAIVPRFPGYEPYLLIAPFGVALLAYYSRGLAIALFVGLVLLFLL